MQISEAKQRKLFEEDEYWSTDALIGTTISQKQSLNFGKSELELDCYSLYMLKRIT